MKFDELLPAWTAISQQVRLLAARDSTRQQLNALYRTLSRQQMSLCHALFAKLFRNVDVITESGQWLIDFVDKEIRLPIRRDRIWLDWDTALSVLGHEPEIKTTYSHLLRSSLCPETFIDVGCSYGTHSILFLRHGIETLSFEPNPLCQVYFHECCALNSLKPTIIETAVGDSDCITTLSYPEQATWLGTTAARERHLLRTRPNLREQTVRQTTLDQYFADRTIAKVLIKIDTEGSDYAVLLGGINTIERCRPTIIFESFRGALRNNIFNFFSTIGYDISALPWHPDCRIPKLVLGDFLDSHQSNFISIPQ